MLRSSEESDGSEQLSLAVGGHVVPFSTHSLTLAGLSPSLCAPADPADELYLRAKSQLARGILPDLLGVRPVALQLELWDRLEQSIEEEQQMLERSKGDLPCHPQLPALPVRSSL